MLSRSVSSNQLKSRSATFLSTNSQRRMFALHPPRRSDRLPTFHHQRSLPRLPVPPLRTSLDRYLKSLDPVLEQNEETGGEKKDAALRTREEWAREFENGLGKALQQRLIGTNSIIVTKILTLRLNVSAFADLDRASPNNWLNDNFWLKKAYHEWRAPLPVNSNWWLLFHDDPNVPEDLRRSIPSSGDITEWQVRRAAWLVRRLVDFKEKLAGSAFISISPIFQFVACILTTTELPHTSLNSGRKSIPIHLEQVRSACTSTRGTSVPSIYALSFPPKF